jgi:hypothetical protein
MALTEITSLSIKDAEVKTADIAADAVTAAKIADDVINSEHIAAGAVDLEHMSSESVDEDNLHISNAGSNGQFLQKQSGNNGGLTWATVDLTTFTADVTFDNQSNAGRDIIWDESDDALEFADDVKASFGTGGDLQIFHNGSNSYIDDTGTGDLFIRGAANLYITNANGTETKARFTNDGSCELYYDNAKKLETTSGGVTVTGLLSTTANVGVQDTGRFYFGNSDVASIDGSHGGSGYLKFLTNGTERMKIDASGHLLPNANNTYDLGSSSLGFRNIHTNDLHLSNEGSVNDVDGTWGKYTIQEGEDDLFLINRRNGKKYKFNLTEVS